MNQDLPDPTVHPDRLDLLVTTVKRDPQKRRLDRPVLLETQDPTASLEHPEVLEALELTEQ